MCRGARCADRTSPRAGAQVGTDDAALAGGAERRTYPEPCAGGADALLLRECRTSGLDSSWGGCNGQGATERSGLCGDLTRGAAIRSLSPRSVSVRTVGRITDTAATQLR